MHPYAFAAMGLSMVALPTLAALYCICGVCRGWAMTKFALTAGALGVAVVGVALLVQLHVDFAIKEFSPGTLVSLVAAVVTLVYLFRRDGGRKRPEPE